MDEANLTANLFFAAALRVGGDAAGTRLLPLDLLREPLAPHARFSQRILLALQALGFIEPELSRSHAEDWLLGRDWIEYGFNSISWRVLKNPSSIGWLPEPGDWLDELDDSSEFLEVLVGIWEDLASAEVAEYARWSLSRSAFNPDWADEAFPALQEGLRHFGINQVMYLIYIALRSVAMAHQRGGVSIASLGHVFASSVANYTHRAIAEGWRIRGMTRSPELPRSSITVLFADGFTGLGDRYFTEKPSTQILVSALMSRQTLH